MNINILSAIQKRIASYQKEAHYSSEPMIKSLHIENFRCFKTLDVEDLGQFNILVGPNGAGKTAFLEALFLPGGRHDLVFLLRQLRGITQPVFAPVKEVYESLWGDLFYKFSQSAIITIAIRGTTANARTLKIYYKKQEPLLIGFQGASPLPNMPEPSTIIPLTFETEFEGKLYSNQAIVANGQAGQGLQITGDQPPIARIAFVPFLGSPSIAQQFSQIDRTRNGKTRLLSAIKKVFPIIEDISVQTHGFGMSDLYCTISELEDKIPLALLSGGINRFLTILINIATQENGVVLVDEIDNGIFHQTFENVWRSLIVFCKQYNVQLFASTHSKECLDALSSLTEGEMTDFRVLRTESQNGEGHSVKLFSGIDFQSALKVGIDPRQPD